MENEQGWCSQEYAMLDFGNYCIFLLTLACFTFSVSLTVLSLSTPPPLSPKHTAYTVNWPS